MRFQLIWRAPEHYNHVHFGIKPRRWPRVLMTPLAPVFIPNSREPWWPVPVEACARARATLVRPAGGQKFLNPRDLQDLPDGGYLNFPADMRQPLDEPVAGYMRIKVGRPLTWVQWWLFYLYNPKAYPLDGAGWGAHEGDWEVVQVGYHHQDTGAHRPDPRDREPASERAVPPVLGLRNHARRPPDRVRGSRVARELSDARSDGGG